MKVQSVNFNLIDEFISYDPGGTTGYAKCKIIRQPNKRPLLVIREYGEFPTYKNIRRHLTRVNFMSFAVVYESFSAKVLPVINAPIEVIGVIKFLAGEKKLITFGQPPTAKRIMERAFPELAKKLVSHHGDAIRHAIYFAVFKMCLKDPRIIIQCREKDFSKKH